MTNENFDRWLEVLATTNLPQGDGYLCIDGAYCCLGIGCLIADDPEVKAWVDAEQQNELPPLALYSWMGIPVEGERGKINEAYLYDHTGDLLIDWQTGDLGQQGKPDENPQDMGWISHLTVAGLNDSGFTFKQIADVLRYFGPSTTAP